MTTSQRLLRLILAGLLLALSSVALLVGPGLAQVEPPGPGLQPGEELADQQVQIGSAHFRIDWSVMASGGSRIGSAHYGLASTIGQPATGRKDSTHFNGCTGFWCFTNFLRRLLLPLIMDEFTPP